MEDTIKRTAQQRYYAKNRETLKAKSKAFRDRDPILHNARALESKRKNWDSYLAKSKETGRRLRAELKARAIASLGGHCVQCGYDTDIRALQIDHIHSNGAEERRQNSSQWALYKSIVHNGDQGRYQVLCANCNVIKRMEVGEHPVGGLRRSS